MDSHGLVGQIAKNKAKDLAKVVKAHPEIVDATDDDGMMLLHHAAKDNAVECIAVLLDADARINAQDTKHGWTPMHHAVEALSVQAVKALLAAPSLDLTVQATAYGGYTPLILTVVNIDCGDDMADVRADQCDRRETILRDILVYYSEHDDLDVNALAGNDTHILAFVEDITKHSDYERSFYARMAEMLINHGAAR